MDLSLWRTRSRVVAYIDLILSSLGLIFTIFFVIVGAAATAVIVDQKDKHEDKHESESHVTAFLWLMWVSFVFMAIFVAIDLWAAIMLLKATTPGGDPKKALHRAKVWRNVNVAFLIISVLYYLISSSFFSLAIEVIFRGTLLYIVSKFIEDLGQYAETPFPATPDSVEVK